MKKFERDISLMIKVSKLYYEDDFTFTEIGDILKLSRFQVANIIKSAKKTGIVKIIIDEELIDENIELAESIEKYFKIDRVIVVDNRKLSDHDIRNKIGLTTANLLIDILKDGDIISLTTSSTVNAVADTITNKNKINNIKIVEANGGSNVAYSNSVHEISRKFAGIFNAPHYAINAPIIVDSSNTRKILLNQKNIRKTYKLFDNINVLLFGIGTFYPKINKLMIESGDLHKEEFIELKRLYASGNILYYYYDIEGNFLLTNYDNKIICLPREKIKSIPYKIASVYGGYKKYGVLGALRTGLINFLVLDSILAGEIMEIKDTDQREYKKIFDKDLKFQKYFNEII